MLFRSGLLVIGGVVGGVAMAWNVFAVGADGGLWVLVPSLLLFGAAIGLVGITSLSAALSGIEPVDLAEANSVFQTSRRQVQTFGIAVVIGLLGDRTTDSVDRFRLVWIVSGVCFVLSSVVAAWYPSRGNRQAGA